MHKKITAVFYALITVFLSISAVTINSGVSNPPYNLDTLKYPFLFRDNKPGEVVKSPKELAENMYVRGEILVKFKDEVSVNINRMNGKTQIKYTYG